MKIAVVANPHSGGRKGKKLIPYIEKSIQQLDIEHDIFYTDYYQHGIEIARKLDVTKYDRIYSAGGDGTNYEVLNGLLKHHDRKNIPPLGIIPMGSGNSFARDLDIFSSEDGVETLTRDSVKEVDVLSFSFSGEEYFFVNLTGLGFVTDVARTASFFKFFGDFSYVIGVFHRLAGLKFHDMELQIDGKTYSGKNCFVEFCNSKYTGGDMLMAPDAEIDDGLFDVIILSKISRIGLIKTFPRIFKGTHLEHPAVQSIKAKSAVIKTSPSKNLLPDGELFGETPTEIKMYPKLVKYFI